MAISLGASKSQSYHLPEQESNGRENPTLTVLMYGGRGVGKSLIAAWWAKLDDFKDLKDGREEYTIGLEEFDGSVHLKVFSMDQTCEFREQLPHADAVVFVYDTNPESFECIDLMWRVMCSVMHDNQFILVLKNRDDSLTQTHEEQNLMFSLPRESIFLRLPKLVLDQYLWPSFDDAATVALKRLFQKASRCQMQNRHTPQAPRHYIPGLHLINVVYSVCLRKAAKHRNRRKTAQEIRGQERRQNSNQLCCIPCFGKNSEDNDEINIQL